MLVGVDARHLRAHRGVARYTRRMLEHLPGPVSALVPGRTPVPAVAGVEIHRTALPSRVLHGTAALTGRPRVDRLLGDPDVVWLPAPAPVAVSPHVPTVLTVHDLSWLVRPGDFSAYERLWHRVARLRALARRSTLVVCDHEAVGEEVVSRWDLDPGRVRIVEPGADRPTHEIDGGAPLPSLPYVLYVGALEPRKGIDVLARAWASAPLPGHELLVVGEGRLPVPGARMLGRVDDDRLAALYAGALAVVLPSHLEGYGLPPREAAVHGTPAILSDLPTLRVPGSLRFPAGDDVALAAALARLPAERGALVAALCPPPTWERAAAELQAVLAEAAQER
jgi:glycosyltransferase involved in cell wall biosynthesis